MYELNFPILKVIATEVGRDWRMLARHLGLDETIIQGIHQANFGDIHEAALQALLRCGNGVCVGRKVPLS